MIAKEKINNIHAKIQAEHRGLFAFIRSRIHSLEETEDLLQDVYLQALSNLNVLDSVDNLAGWLYTVAKNKVIDWYRKKRLVTVSMDEPFENGLQFKDILSEEIPDTLDDETRDLLLEALVDAIEDLPEKQRYVFTQQMIEERTFRELAEETGESINTLITRKRYAIQFLQSKLFELKSEILER